MRAALYFGDSPHQRKAARLISAGFRQHDIQSVFICDSKAESCDFAVTWGAKRSHLFDRFPTLVIERAYLGDREHWHSLGWNGLNGHADFCNTAADDSRVRKYWPDVLKSWRRGEYQLLLGQCPGDAAVPSNYVAWLNGIADEMEGFYRPHPVDAAPCKLQILSGSLDESLAVASLAVAWNSNALVLAACAGVPTVAFDRGAMTWEISAHGVFEQKRPDRTEWLNKLSFCQWTPGEIASGDAWEHLKGFLE